jgi:hypothetical protein
LAYADPPYLGCGKQRYGELHSDAGRYDTVEGHEALVVRLRDEFPDGWALSLHSPSIEEYAHIARRVLGPNQVRFGAWVKPFHAYKRGVRPAYAWEPIMYRGGRNTNHPPPPKGGKATTPKDFVSCNITLKRGLAGVKPERFSLWIFDILGMRPDDEFHDLFPGTGAVTVAWGEWQRQLGAA